MHRNIPSFRVFLAGLAVVLVPALTAAAQPYPASTVITDVQFDWSTHDRRAPGSDNWPITWRANDEQMTSFGDGGGFGGTNSQGRVSLGFSRVTGPAGNYDGQNVWGGANAESPAQFGGKSYGIIDISGTLYAWWGPGSGGESYTETRLLRSVDGGASWQESSWDLQDVDSTIVMPTILNFGRGYEGARDDYVYHYFIRKERTDLGVHKSDKGRIDLARVPKDQIFELGAYEWFAGLQNGQPQWTSSAANRAPVFEDSNGVGWNVSVSYNEGLGRYFLMTEHGTTFQGQLGMFDAPEPWGPWTTVRYLDFANHFGIGHIEGSTFFWNFSNKWMSADGKDFVMVFSGVSTNDSWNTVEGSFTVNGGDPTVPKPPVVEEP